MAGSGSNPNPEEDRPSTSLSPSEERTVQGSYILIVEDNVADVFLIRAAMKAADIQPGLRVVTDGEQAIRLLDEVERDHSIPCPALVILDINLPRRHGGEVLQQVRQSSRCGQAPVIAVSTSDSLLDREHMKQLGANAYFRKPSSYADFMKLGDMVRALLDSGSWPA